MKFISDSKYTVLIDQQPVNEHSIKQIETNSWKHVKEFTAKKTGVILFNNHKGITYGIRGTFQFFNKGVK